MRNRETDTHTHQRKYNTAWEKFLAHVKHLVMWLFLSFFPFVQLHKGLGQAPFITCMNCKFQMGWLSVSDSGMVITHFPYSPSQQLPERTVGACQPVSLPRSMLLGTRSCCHRFQFLHTHLRHQGWQLGTDSTLQGAGLGLGQCGAGTEVWINFYWFKFGPRSSFLLISNIRHGFPGLSLCIEVNSEFTIPLKWTR